MADAFPTFTPYTADPRFVGQWTDPLPTPAPAAAPVAPPPPNGVLTDIGHGLSSGLMVGLPTMAGQALQAFSPAGSTLAQTGQSWRDAATARASEPGYQTTGVWGEGAKSVAPSLALLPAAALGALAGPAGAAAAGGAAAAALFGGSTFKDVQERALQQGATSDVANEAGFKAGMLMGAGQAAAAMVGGKILAGAGGAIANAVLKRGALQNSIEAFSNPSLFTNFAKNFAETMGVQLPVQAGVAAGMNSIEQGAGIDTKQTSWEAAKASFAPTAAMTTLLAPLSIFGAHQSVQQREAIARTVANPAADANDRIQALAAMTKEMGKTAPLADAKAWEIQALEAINAGEPVAMRADFNAVQARQEATQAAEVARQAALPPTPTTPSAEDVQGTLDSEGGGQPQSKSAEQVDVDAAPIPGEHDYAAAQEALDQRTRDETPRLPYRAQDETIEIGRGGEPIALPDRNKPPVVPEPDYPPTKAGETKYIRAKFELPPSTPGTSVIDRLRGLDHEQQLDELTKIYDPTKDAGYMEAIGDALKKAGRLDAEGNTRENTRGDVTDKAPAEERAGAEPQSTPVQAEPKAATSDEQVAQAQGDAVAGGTPSTAAQSTGEELTTQEARARAKKLAARIGAGDEELPPVFDKPSGDVNALANREEERGGQHQNGDEGGQTATTSGGDSTVEKSPRGADAIQKGRAKAVTRQAAAEREVEQAYKQLDAHKAATQTLIDKANALRLVQKTTPTKESFARLTKLEREISERRANERDLEQLHSDAVGRAENTHPEGEPAYTAGYHSYANPGAVERSSHVDTLAYLADKQTLGHALSDEQRELLVGRGPEKEGKKSQAEAAEAMRSLSDTQRKIFDGRVEQLIRNRKIAADMLSIAKMGEAKIRRSAAEEVMDEAHFNEGLDANDRNLAKGLITPGEHEANILGMMADAIDQHGNKNRGLAALSDSKLAAKLAANPNVVSAMQHIGAVHHNPIVRAVARLLAKANPTAEIRVVTGADFNGGRYNPSTHTIELGRGGVNAITLMHETAHSLAHAALYRAMDNLGRAQDSLHPQARKEVAALRTVRDVMAKFAEVADVKNEEHRLALEDEHEFLAEALNNPEIQEKLGGRSGAVTRFTNAVRELVGLDPKHQTDFERLMSVSPTLFGNPNRSLTREFRAAIDRTAQNADGSYKDSPAGARVEMQNAMSKMAELVAGSGKWHSSTWDARATAAALKWTTFNNGAQWLQRYAGQIKLKFPEHAAKVEEFVKAYMQPKSVLDKRASENNHYRNGPMEANHHMREMARFATQSPAEFSAMHELMRRARQTGVFPQDKTLAEAQKRNPKITQEMFDEPQAKQNRAEYVRMKARDDAAKARDKTALTASDVYAHTETYHALMLARQTAVHVDNMRKLAGYARDPQLDPMTHAFDKDYRSQLIPQKQLDALDSALTRARVEANVGGNEGYAATIKGMLDEHERQRATPYVHFGRSGDLFVHFEIADKPGLYDRVRQIVAGDTNMSNPADTGLGRDMGPEIAGGSRTVHMRFENEMQQKAAIAKLEDLRKEGVFDKTSKDAVGNDTTENTWAAGRIGDHTKVLDGVTPSWLRGFEERIKDQEWSDDVKKQALNELRDAYIQSLSDGNPLKAAKRADLSAGASRDMLASYADRMTMANHGLVTTASTVRMGEAMGRIDAALKDINGTPGSTDTANHLGVYRDEIKGRVADMQQPVNTPIRDALRAFAAPFRLALSPAYMVMTAYQPLQMTLPTLGGKHGFTNTALSMGRAYGKAFGALNHMFVMAREGGSEYEKLLNSANPAVDFSRVKNKDGTPAFNGAELEMMNHLQLSNLVNFGQMQQIFRPGGEEGVAKPLGKLQQANQIASMVPHYIEMANRIVSALSAHELLLTDKVGRNANEKQRQDAMNSATPEQRQAAREYATSTIRNTDGDHSQANVARALGRRGFLGGTTPLVVGFNQYDFQMSESLVRMLVTAVGKGNINSEDAKIARKQIGGVMLMTSLMAGTLGMPFMGLLTGLYNRIVGMGQDDSETPPDFQKSWRDAMAGVFGEQAGEIVSRGLPRLLDIDMSSRSGYQDLAPFTALLEDRQKIKDTISSQAVNFLGPAIGVGIGMVTGAAAYMRGNPVEAINDALPAFARNAATAYRLGQYGYERQSDGNAPIPIEASSWNVMAKAAGFQSGKIAEHGETAQAWQDNQNIMQQRLAKNRDKWLIAMQHNDPAGVSEAFENIIRISAEQPQFASAPRGLAEAYGQRQQATEVERQVGARVSKKQIPFFQQFHGGDMPTMQPYAN